MPPPMTQNVLPWLLLEPSDDRGGVFAQQLHSRPLDALERAREDVGRDPRHRRSVGLGLGRADFPRAPAHDDGVDGRPEPGHVVLDVLAHVQPVDCAIRARDEPVEAAGRAVDDLPHRPPPAPAAPALPRGVRAFLNDKRETTVNLYHRLETRKARRKAPAVGVMRSVADSAVATKTEKRTSQLEFAH